MQSDRFFVELDNVMVSFFYKKGELYLATHGAISNEYNLTKIGLENLPKETQKAVQKALKVLKQTSEV